MLNEALETVDGSNDAQEAAKNVAGSNDLESQRKSFINLGLTTESLIERETKIRKNLQGFLSHGLGVIGAYWLSSIEEIQNQYYGAKMFSCGKVEKVIH